MSDTIPNPEVDPLYGDKPWLPDPEETEREAVMRAVMNVITNAMNYPEPVIHHILGRDMKPLGEKITRSVLAMTQYPLRGTDRTVYSATPSPEEPTDA